MDENKNQDAISEYEKFYENSVNEEWYFLANSAWVESAKIVIAGLLEALGRKPVGRNSSERSAAGNYIGMEIKFPIDDKKDEYKIGVVINILPPEEDDEIEILVIKMETGEEITASVRLFSPHGTGGVVQ